MHTDKDIDLRYSPEGLSDFKLGYNPCMDILLSVLRKIMAKMLFAESNHKNSI